MFLGDRSRTVLEDRRIDLTWIDVGDADAFISHFIRHRRAESRHRKLAGAVNDATERDRPLAGYRRDVDNQSVLSRSASPASLPHAAIRAEALIDKTRSQSSGDISAIVRFWMLIPALLTRMSTSPTFSRMSAKKALTLSGSAHVQRVATDRDARTDRRSELLERFKPTSTHGDLAASLRKSPGDSGTDSCSTTCDGDNFSCELTHALRFQ